MVVARQDLDKVEEELARPPEGGTIVAERVATIMGVASAIDTSRSSFALGQVFEALRPMRVRATLLAQRERLLKLLVAAESQDEESDSDAP